MLCSTNTVTENGIGSKSSGGRELSEMSSSLEDKPSFTHRSRIGPSIVSGLSVCEVDVEDFSVCEVLMVSSLRASSSVHFGGSSSLSGTGLCPSGSGNLSRRCSLK